MRVQRFDNFADLLPFCDAWERLAGGTAFRDWTWLAAWWKHYGAANPDRELHVLVAFEGDLETPEAACAILPAYVQSTWTQGRVIRLLGDGEVCSDHLGLLTTATHAKAAAAALAQTVAAEANWEALEFAGVDRDDAATQRFLDELAECDCMISRTPQQRCWAIELPPTWEEFLAMQSKSHRKQLRQLERRVLASARAEWRLVEATGQFGDAWSTLVDLHQRRRQSLGEPGCFASPTWAAFHWEVAQQMLAQGRLRLSTLHLDGQPLAAEYHLVDGNATWAYQGGVDPTRLADEPGQLSMIRAIQRAIADGCTRFDLLRGDEPYKAHWRAAPAETDLLAAVPNRLWPRLRNSAYSGAKNLRNATRQFAGRFH